MSASLRTLSAFTFATLTALLSASHAGAVVVYSETFDVNNSANWTALSGGGTNAANFFYDYKASAGIPSAPHSTGGSTIGAQFRANLGPTGALTGVSASPNGFALPTGDYRVSFDWWGNYHGGLAAGGTGSTHMGSWGVGTAATATQWAGASTIDGVTFATTVDGGATNDFRAYSNLFKTGVGYAGDSTVFAAPLDPAPPLTGGIRNNATNAYYSSIIGGNTAPADQVTLFSGQTGTTSAQSPGFEWHFVEMLKSGTTLTFKMDGLTIANIDLTTVTLGGSNIHFGAADINSTVASGNALTNPPASLLFSLVDNITVEAVPEAGSVLFGGVATILGGVGAWLGRRKA